MKKLAAIFAVVVIFMWLPLALTLRKGFSVEGVHRLLANPDLLSSLNQSLVLAAVSSVLATVMGTLTAFALPKLSQKWRERFETTLLLPLLLPEIALGLALLVWFVKIGVDFGWGTLIAGHVGFSFTYSTLVMKASVESLDRSLVDAARDLGAPTRSVLRHALLPQIWPGLVSSLATCFALSLDDFLITFFIKGMDQVTLPIKIFSMLRLSVGVEIYTLSLFLCGISIVGVLVSQLCFGKKRMPLGF